MVPRKQQTIQTTDGWTDFHARFPSALYKTLRKYVLVEREQTVSINAFIVLAVQEKLSAEGVSLT